MSPTTLSVAEPQADQMLLSFDFDDLLVGSVVMISDFAPEDKTNGTSGQAHCSNQSCYTSTCTWGECCDCS